MGPDGSRLALKDATGFGWTLFDLHGDLAGLENQAMNAVTDALRYDGYGLSIDADGAFGSPWRYQGALDVSPNGNPLYDLGARFYAPSLGAFTSLDSVAGSAADPLSMNRFLYAEANPATLVDPTGHNAIVEDGTIIREQSLYKKPVSARKLLAHKKYGTRTSAQVAGDARFHARTASRYGETGQFGERRPYRKTPTASWRDAHNALISDYYSTVPQFEEDQARWNALYDANRAHADDVGYVFHRPTVHDALNELGLMPVFGIAADVPNAILYASEGDWGNAALAGASVVPVGEIANYGIKGARALGAADRLIDFAHGTTVANAERILDEGVSESAIRGASSGSREPGSFFTIRIDPNDPDAALEHALWWARERHGGECVVVVCSIPEGLADQLERNGLLRNSRQPIESVFRPGSFPLINEYRANWQVVRGFEP